MQVETSSYVLNLYIKYMHIRTDNKDMTASVFVCVCVLQLPNKAPPLEEQPGHGDQYT